MELEKTSIVLRPRNAWEAMDLGFTLIRHYWLPVYRVWLATVLPFFLLLNIVFHNHLWIAVLVFWWLKPLYDRFVLQVISREVFGASCPVKQTLNTLPQSAKTGLLASLTRTRLDLARSFNLPVWQLEGLRAGERRARQRILQKRSRSHAVWLTVVCIHLEVVINFSLIGIVLLFLPEGYDNALYGQIFLKDQTTWYQLFSNFSYFIAVTVMEPMYVSAGFSLYINRRTLLEAWDIELTFRRMAARLKKTRPAVAFGLCAILFSLSGMFGLLVPQSADATPELPDSEQLSKHLLPPSQAHEIIQQVLEAPEFQTRIKKEQWRFKFSHDPAEQGDKNGFWAQSGLGDVLAVMLEVLLWLGLGLALALIFIYRRRWIDLFGQRPSPDREHKPLETLAGMDIRRDSLPQDIAREARKLWLQGQRRHALGLLYRGSLMEMVSQEGLALHNGHTEADVLSLSRETLSPEKLRYLERLTNLWQSAAYAHHLPKDEQGLSLCDQWPYHIGATE